MGNVLINGRSAVHAGSGGVVTTVDVCRTPSGKGTDDIPYTNVAQSADAGGTASSVKINGHPVCVRNSVFSKSMGDEAGRKGGIVSGTTQGQAEFVTASPNVFIEGVPAVRMGDMMVSNNRNTPPEPLQQPGGTPPPDLAAGDPQAQEPDEGPDHHGLEIKGGNLPGLRGSVTLVQQGDE
ncbi:hypothetical protein CAI21_15360 [Alkalilimnicola ehrlichii]|uniref:Uncharacterized protein n=1 Tax=Alkalilimnicola ehrlichii TaxID=351052 RepID=A0A3E0WTU5_9GAMM|nr:DUF4150 domain-containing protein [Alkalilimnicola ehrlichii]RFA27223.1 hypothetical protein CAI21_15360 [Alkalilimnicola ehrlichii]RFA35396.1 hypothetical protein CAL65_13025 [Alkalilimnicola ehrlichii]